MVLLGLLRRGAFQPAEEKKREMCAVVAVWGTNNIEQCRSRIGQPLLFLIIAAKYDGDLELTLWHERLVDHECSCARVTQLKELPT